MFSLLSGIGNRAFGGLEMEFEEMICKTMEITGPASFVTMIGKHLFYDIGEQFLGDILLGVQIASCVLFWAAFITFIRLWREKS